MPVSTYLKQQELPRFVFITLSSHTISAACSVLELAASDISIAQLSITKKGKLFDRGGDRTHNLRIRSPMPYPLGHTVKLGANALD